MPNQDSQIVFLFSFKKTCSRKKMSSSSLNHQANNGLPICLAGIIRPLPLSKEMTDHDGRREALRVQMGEKWNTDQVRSHGREKISEADAQLIAALLSDLCLACTAKAA